MILSYDLIKKEDLTIPNPAQETVNNTNQPNETDLQTSGIYQYNLINDLLI